MTASAEGTEESTTRNAPAGDVCAALYDGRTETETGPEQRLFPYLRVTRAAVNLRRVPRYPETPAEPARHTR